jgi:carbamoyltransferase
MRMTNEAFHQLFGGPPREPGAPLDERYMDVARSIQTVTEEIMLRLARHTRDITGQKNLCLAGGVTLNCVANGKILREKMFQRMWIQPAAGDAGGAVGAALAVWHEQKTAGVAEPKHGSGDAMHGALLGPEYSDEEIETVLRSRKAVYTKLDDETLFDRTVDLLRQEKVVGWFQGRMEFGPRALGNRSILGDARSPGIQSTMNLKIKFRESFRPFAPVVRGERVSDYFDLDVESPYMLVVAPVKKELCHPTVAPAKGIDRVNELRSCIPAVTHVDYSARIQTVSRDQNPRLYGLLERFERATGCGVLVNTSFNVRGEPIVCSPDDAYRCFVRTQMDFLVIGNYVLDRAKQPSQKAAADFSPLPD